MAQQRRKRYHQFKNPIRDIRKFKEATTERDPMPRRTPSKWQIETAIQRYQNTVDLIAADTPPPPPTVSNRVDLTQMPDTPPPPSAATTSSSAAQSAPRVPIWELLTPPNVDDESWFKFSVYYVPCCGITIDIQLNPSRTCPSDQSQIRGRSASAVRDGLFLDRHWLCMLRRSLSEEEVQAHLVQTSCGEAVRAGRSGWGGVK